jgi:putative multiple sugar transport system ATP-binding protein
MKGRPITVRTVREAIKSGIAYATEDRKQLGLILGSDLKFNISLASIQRVVSKLLVNEPQEWAVAKGYMQEMSIKAPSAAANVGTLSGGNQQKIVLSKWMFTDADVLILDEPTRGVDVGAKFEIYTIINRLAEGGKGIVLISSELPELQGMCDRIVVFSEGRITGELQSDSATAEELMQLMTKGNRND